MKKFFPLLVAIVMLSMFGCGGGSDEETPPPEPECNTYFWLDDASTECGQQEFCGEYMYEGLRTFTTQEECDQALAAMLPPTPAPEPTPPAPTPTPTEPPIVGGDKDEHGCIPSAGYEWCEEKQKCLRPWEEECVPAEPTPAPEPTPEPTVDPNSIEVALQSITHDLGAVAAEIDGNWQAHAGPNALSLSSFEPGMGYWIYVPHNVSLQTPAFTHAFFEGWNMSAWVSPADQIADALQGYENAIPIVIGWDAALQKYAIYITESAIPLSVLQPGQAYNSFVQDPIKFQVGANEIDLNLFDTWTWQPIP